VAAATLPGDSRGRLERDDLKLGRERAEEELQPGAGRGGLAMNFSGPPARQPLRDGHGVEDDTWGRGDL
jgi:hypothetical protein